MNSKYLEYVAVTIFSFAGLFALHQLVAAHSHVQPAGGHGAGDWAAWFGALGTIAAAGIALWIATYQERTRRRIELTQANIVAAKLAPKLGAAYLGVGSFLLKLEWENTDRLPPNTSEVAKVLISRQSLQVEVGDLVALAGLGDGNATKLAYVIGLLDALRERVALHVDNNSTIHETQTEIWRRAALDITERLYVIQVAFDRTAKIHAPVPSLEELHGITDETGS